MLQFNQFHKTKKLLSIYNKINNGYKELSLQNTYPKKRKTMEEEESTFISCVSWILRGYAASVPKQVEMTEDEINQMKSDPMVREGLLEGEATQNMMQEDDDDNMPIFGDDINEMMNSKSTYPMAIDDLSDDEKDDFYIKDTDALIVAGKVEKQHASLEVYIYEQERNNMYVHHEVMLSSFPLDIQWLRVSLGSIGSNQHKKGNYAIVGSFLPEIQFWNLDVLEAVEPQLALGGELQSKSKKPKKFTNKSKKFKDGSHTDSVISLSLNASNISVLASASADSTVKIWDISKQQNIYTAEHHTSRVNKVEWNKSDVSVLFSCSDDKTIAILDSRFPGDKIVHKTAANQSVESACWNVNTPSQIAYVTDKGFLHLFDARMPQKILASQQVHLSSVNDVKISNKNLLYTCSEDQYVRIWSLNDLSKPLAAKNPKCGKLFCIDVMQLDDGPILSVGNEKGELFVWQITENQQVNEYFKTN